MLAGSAALVVLGVWLVGLLGVPQYIPHEHPLWYSATIGWLSIVMGAFGWLNAVRIFEPREQFRIDQNGIKWVRWSSRTIPWSEIVHVATHKNPRTGGWGKFIVLQLRDPQKFPGRGILRLLSGLNRALVGGHIHLDFVATNRSADEALTAIAYFSKARSGFADKHAPKA